MRRAALVRLALAALAGCGSSPEDEAREDGEQVGAAVRDLYDAQSPEEAANAVTALLTARGDLREDARDHVSTEVQTQAAALRAAGEEFAAGGSVEDLRASIQEVRAQAEAFGESNDSVVNEFWRGFQDGYDES